MHKATFWSALVVAGSVATGALAQMPSRDHRTASWYASNPAILDRVTAICRNDPGHTSNNPDCINAEQARSLVAEREAISHRNATDLTPASDPRYWRIHPSEIALQQAICSRLPSDPRVQSMNNCPSLHRYLER